MRKHKFLLTFLLFIVSSLCSITVAEEVSFVARAENTVVMGQRFQVQFILTNADADNFQMPSMDNFQVLSGPNRSSSTSMSFVNGKRTTTSSTTLSYILAPTKEGTFTIPSAKAIAGGNTYRSNALTIKVIQGESNAQGNSGNNNRSQQQQSQQAANTAGISNDDIFVRTEVSKSKVYEQEQFLATVKLYYRAQVRGLDDWKLPEYKGFLAQDVELADDKKYGRENVNGKVYNTLILKQSVLTPQKSGALELGKGSLTAIAQVRVSNGGGGGWPFGDFFTQTRDVQKPVQIPNVTINVQELPSKGKPEDFSGAVGAFTLESSITPEGDLKTNEAITVKVRIKGCGNIKYAKAPKIVFPNDFEIYEPKIDNKTKASESGVSGTKEIEYLAIARYPGEYTIPAAEFTYFDIKSKTYKTLKTKEFKFNVEKGANDDVAPTIVTTTKENVKFIGASDIRFINTKDLEVRPKNDFLFGSTAYILWFVLPIIAFVVAYFFLRKLAQENANVALVRNRKANKQATKRLKEAKKFMDADDKAKFYEEISKALWGYVSDKMNIPLVNLNKDNVATELAKRSATDETIKEFISKLDTCEFARFAPAAVSQTMDEAYASAEALIGKLENEIR